LVQFFWCRVASRSRCNGDHFRKSIGCGHRCFTLTPSLPSSGLIHFQCVISRCDRRCIVSIRRWLRCGIHRTHIWQQFSSIYGGVGSWDLWTIGNVDRVGEIMWNNRDDSRL
jgi:hypothetical protein